MNLIENLDNLNQDEYFSKHTTLQIGGKIKYFYSAKTTTDLKNAVKAAISAKVPHLVIGSGSDLLVSDTGFDGLVIENKTANLETIGEILKVDSGVVLQDFINYCINNGFSGNELMSGIPGTVGGAIYGNAGAYGQTISDFITKVKTFDGNTELTLSKEECEFSYRESKFKENKFTILSAEFIYPKGDSSELKKKAIETIELRSKKYPIGIKCPGSFFKNVLASDLSPDVLQNIPEDKIMYGKIPAGYLLETVGAKGSKRGQIEIATYHGNLFINTGNGTAEDFLSLSNEYKVKVHEKFGIKLEPEVQLIGF